MTREQEVWQDLRQRGGPKEEVKTVIFCDFTKGRELVNSLRELMRRMERTEDLGVQR